MFSIFKNRFTYTTTGTQHKNINDISISDISNDNTTCTQDCNQVWNGTASLDDIYAGILKLKIVPIFRDPYF